MIIRFCKWSRSTRWTNCVFSSWKKNVDNYDDKDDENDDDDDGTVDDGGGKSAVYADGRYQAFEQPAKESKMVPRGSS